jgi:hypothetical protein
MPILSESQIRQATPRDKAHKIYDSGGLYLKVSTSGACLRFRDIGTLFSMCLALHPFPNYALGYRVGYFRLP